jgi:pilus assembly protein Flp/PilA
MTKLMRQFWNDEDGATMVEYGLMVALIAVVCIVTVTTLGGDLNAKFGQIVAAL